ncbi:MAG: hypothetical protein JWQ33_2842 [Ramlibacter sp.]|nr:hypothetical protein [Ramlibacter sp.]
MKRRRPSMKQRLLAVALVAGCGFAGAAGAMSKDQYLVERDKAQAAYKNAWDSCKALTANAKAVCKAEARGNYEVAKADLDARLKPTPKHDDRVKTEKAAAAYKLATEKCGDLSGNAKDVCRKDARAGYVAATGEARLSRASVDDGVYSRNAVNERNDVREDTADAQFAAARERCAALSAQAKSACVADAKKKFGKL